MKDVEEKGAEGENAQVSDDLQPEKGGANKKASHPQKQRLVSYSSRDSSSTDVSGSRKSTRKRTAVSKWERY